MQRLKLVSRRNVGARVSSRSFSRPNRVAFGSRDKLVPMRVVTQDAADSTATTDGPEPPVELVNWHNEGMSRFERSGDPFESFTRERLEERQRKMAEAREALGGADLQWVGRRLSDGKLVYLGGGQVRPLPTLRPPASRVAPHRSSSPREHRPSRSRTSSRAEPERPDPPLANAPLVAAIVALLRVLRGAR